MKHIERRSETVAISQKIPFSRLRWAILAILMAATYYSGYRFIHSFSSGAIPEMSAGYAQPAAEKEGRTADPAGGEALSPSANLPGAGENTASEADRLLPAGTRENSPADKPSQPGFGPRQTMIILLFPLLILIIPVVTVIDIGLGRFSGNARVFWIITALVLPVVGSVFYFAIGRREREKAGGRRQ